MLGYPYEVVCETITNTIATVGGMVCDGAKSSCAAKISTALQTALLGMKMGLHDRAFQPGEGLVEDDVEKQSEVSDAWDEMVCTPRIWKF